MDDEIKRNRAIDVDAALSALARDIVEDRLYRAAADIARGAAGGVHVVGGTVRDALLGRAWHDLDVALPASNVVPFARSLAEATGATLVPLDDRLPTVRVVSTTATGRREVDLSGHRGVDLVSDLRARDLTVNALAVPLAALCTHEAVEIVDPTGGLLDLARGIVRVPSPGVLADDPLRGLRAHRFAATLGFEIEPGTRAAIRAHASRLAESAVERVAEELIKTLSAPTAGARLTHLWDDGLLAVIFPEVAAMEGVSQNTFHHLDVLRHTLAACREVDEIRRDPGTFYGAHGDWVEAYLEDGDNAALVVLATLLHDVAKPATRFIDEAGVHFYRHESLGAEMTEAVGARLRLSARQTARLVQWVAQHLGLKDLIGLHREGRLADRTVRRFLRRAGEDLAGLLCVVLADTRATRGPDFPPDGERLLLEVSTRLVGEDRALRSDPRNGQPLLRGRDLIAELGLAPGPELGRILADVEDARLDGTVRERDDALAWVRARLEGTRAGRDG